MYKNCSQRLLNQGKFEDFEFFETEKKVKAIYMAWEIQKKSARGGSKSTGEGFKQEEITLLMAWFQPLLRIVCRKQTQESSVSWVPLNGRENVKIMFVKNPGGFANCNPALKKALPNQKIDILIADSDYGFKEEPWDLAPWVKEFEQSLNFVFNHNGDLEDCCFFFFLTDKQFVDAIIAVQNQKLNYRVVTWSKGGFAPFATGSRFRTTTEFILIAWEGKTKILL